MTRTAKEVQGNPAGWVLYDGGCPMCIGLVRRFGFLFERRGYCFAPLQTDWVRGRLGLPEEELLLEMKVLTDAGEVIGGADAGVFLLGRLWWGKPLAALARLPGAMPPLRAAYAWIAERRGCRHGRCAVRRGGGWIGWAPLLLASSGALMFGRALPAWAFMWSLSLAIFAGFKWWMFWRARRSGAAFTTMGALAYAAWPGMDAAAFSGYSSPRSIGHGELVGAFLKTGIGAALFWFAARRLPSDQPLLAGWCGMAGLILMLHFGSFHLLSLLLRVFGFRAEPLMHSPLLATSLGDFWGNRWNLAFRQLGYELVFQPFRGVIGASGATALIFLLSGLIHDLVISVPARGGYGLPTLYFRIQGAGVLVEKTKKGKAFGLGRGGRGRSFAIACAAAPAFWLFHPAFVLRIIIPFMTAAGALPGGLR